MARFLRDLRTLPQLLNVVATVGPATVSWKTGTCCYLENHAQVPRIATILPPAPPHQREG
jgi:hypothetical protein